jgi:predicted dinucleotide-binding enzyme
MDSSSASSAAALLPDSHVVAAFHHVSNLVSINRRYKAHAGLRITDI